MQLKRGEIFRIMFPYTFDKSHPTGKVKFVLVLQSGGFFDSIDTTCVLLLTTDEDEADSDTSVLIPQGYGETVLYRDTYVIGHQVYTLKKEIFANPKSQSFGVLDQDKLEEVNEALIKGLCME